VFSPGTVRGILPSTGSAQISNVEREALPIESLPAACELATGEGLELSLKALPRPTVQSGQVTEDEECIMKPTRYSSASLRASLTPIRIRPGGFPS